MKTRVFIVEDELIHAEALKIAIEEAGLELAGESNHADLAFDLIAMNKPDVLLVDIALPGLNNGITLAARVREELKIPHIFTTSFTRDEVIQQAVTTHPSGYLRKPVDAVNLKAAVQIALDPGNPGKKEHSGIHGDDHFFTRIGDKLVRISIADLLIVRADGENYISLVYEKKEISCRITLKEFCRQLPSSFIQVHRGFYINLDHLESFNEREQTAHLKGHFAPVARNFRKQFLNSIRKI
jgi:two-component system, LytTR family, response regulator LytT